MPEIVDSELTFKAIFREVVWWGHDASIIDEHIDFWVFLLNSLGKLTHRLQIPGIQIQIIDFNTVQIRKVNSWFDIFLCLFWVTNTCECACNVCKVSFFFINLIKIAIKCWPFDLFCQIIGNEQVLEIFKHPETETDWEKGPHYMESDLFSRY